MQSIRSELPVAFGMGILLGVLLLVAEWFAPTPMDGEAAVTVSTLIGSLPVRVLYGGITEELLLRWGVMSLLVVILWKVLARKTAQPSSGIVWVAIVLSAVLFGIAHLPSAATTYGAITVDVLVFVLLANGVAGIIFGWLYWRHSLEAAMIAHGGAHLVAVGGSIVLLL